MEHLSLQPISEVDDLTEILMIQKQSFKSLYETYQDDDTSPYKEGLAEIHRRFNMSDSWYYFIEYESKRVGFVRIVFNSDHTQARISPIAILPDYKGKGYGRSAMLDIEQRFPTVREWHLDTIKEEADLVAFYLKLGYKQLEIEEKLTNQMTISYFVKIVE